MATISSTSSNFSANKVVFMKKEVMEQLSHNNQHQQPPQQHHPSYHPPPPQYPNYDNTYPTGQNGPHFHSTDMNNHNNSHVNGTSSPGVIVRGEEVGIVLVVLILWVGAIILFFNRWGKIRMLEPYQPKFCEHHNPNCPMADVPPINSNYPRTFSKYNLASETGGGGGGGGMGSPHFSKCNYHGVNAVSTTHGTTEPLLNGIPVGAGSRSMSMSMAGGLGYPNSLTFYAPPTSSILAGGLSPRPGGRYSGQINRMRQNSVFVTSPSNMPVNLFEEEGEGGLGKGPGASGRKTKSAIDLSTLVLCGEFMDNVRRNSKNSITNL